MFHDLLNQKYIFELNTRIFCLDHNCTIEQLPEWFFDSREVQASDYVWLMGIWKSSEKSIEICKSHEGLNNEFRKCLPDLHENDILGSPYSISEYLPNPMVSKGLERVRRVKEKLNKIGKKLILDFVPNHMSVDTPYLDKFPELFLSKPKGEELCKNSFYHEGNGRVYYHGRDPYFDGWTDTVQWDFSKPGVLSLHHEILSKLAYICDGVRCDMAMLPEEEVFSQTHGKKALDYWKPLIRSIKEEFPDFIFIGEVYWDKEYQLQTKGFDYTYDKTLYDRLKLNDVYELKSHLNADRNYQNKSVRFLENHDEERAFDTFGEDSTHKFSLLSFLPGMILFYEGQTIGSEKKVPVQLGRTPLENYPPFIGSYYDRALTQIHLRKQEEIMETYPTFHSYEAIGYNPLIVKTIHYFKFKPLGSAKVKILHIEILLYNPEDRIISGWFKFDELLSNLIGSLFIDKLEFLDVISGNIYSYDKSDLLSKGIYIKLEPNKSHWFSTNSDLLKNNENS